MTLDEMRARARGDGVMRDDRGRVLPVALDASDAVIGDAILDLDAEEARSLAHLRSVRALGNVWPAD